MAEKIIYLKTIDGQYVIGKEKENNTEKVILEKPISINFEPMMGGLSFTPYDAFYLGKEIQEIEFKNEHIMHIFEGKDIPMEIEQKYREYLSGVIVQKEAPVADMSGLDLAKQLSLK